MSGRLNASFLGPAAENHPLLEQLVVEFLRDHSYWRRNFHPGDPPAISHRDQHDPEYIEFVSRMKDELMALSAELKKAVPFFSPRYVGHMSSDIMLPAFVAKILTTLYNPNNVSEDAAPTTLAKELEVGEQLARMFGMATDPDRTPCAWGHLTSGGTVANYEALWNFRALRFYPVALAQGARTLGLATPLIPRFGRRLDELSPWELLNLSIDETVEVRAACVQSWLAGRSRAEALEIARTINRERIETLGVAEFFARHRDLRPPVVLVPTSGHYSWEKAMKVLGLGTANLRKVGVDDDMRMDPARFEATLETAWSEERPILGAVGVLGTTEFGTVDPIHEMLATRERARKRGLDFSIHIDAAWGGYLTTIFRGADGSFREREEIAQDFERFPSPTVHAAFRALGEVDSITVDPHKLGYVPYAAGAFIARNQEVVNFITQRAAYVFDLGESDVESTTRDRLHNLGQYILEGSKPGSSAAAVHITHRMMPLDAAGFGTIIEETIHACEQLRQIVLLRRDELADLAVVRIPFQSDSNLICLAINPAGNRDLAVMNAFGRELFAEMKVDPDKPVQVKEFIGSYTSLVHGNMAPERAARLLGELGIDPATFVAAPEDPSREADHVFLLRHTLMNPWLAGRDGGRNYLRLYWDYLSDLIRRRLA
ncbi:MAG: pyridoxal-dependent decarboxylase [Planctomycetota bacterium]